MSNELLTREQIRQLMYSWRRAHEGSQEQKLIEDLFILTGTPMPRESSENRQYREAS